MNPASAWTPRIGEQAPGDQSAEREQRALDQQLPHDAGAAGADGDANANSRSRTVARASSMFATLQHAMISSRLTAPNNV